VVQLVVLVYIRRDASIVTNSTIVNNSTTGNGGGIYLTESAPLEIKNTVMYGNTANGSTSDIGINTGASVTSHGYNYIEDTTLNQFNQTGDINVTIETNPLLGTITQDSDGITWGYPLLSDSPLIDEGNCTTIDGSTTTHDQFRDTRNGICNIGALEKIANNLPIITSTPPTSIIANQNYQYTLNATDNDNDSLSWSSINLPSWLNIDRLEQNLTTFAGSGTTGSDDANGTAASFNAPYKMAIDSNGNIFVADKSNHKIRKITPDGVVSTFAGSGSAGSSDGIGTAASFNFPYGVAVDNNDNIYVADSFNHTIRKITTDGNVTTIAGTIGTSGYQDGTGSGAKFNQPQGLTVANDGTIYVADTSNRRIRKVTQAGVVTTLTGDGAFDSDDGPASTASFYNPADVEIDNQGNIIVADKDNHIIRKVTTDGNVTTIAGIGGTSGSTDGEALSSTFKNPEGLTIASDGTIYVADSYNFVIRKITPNGTVSTIAGIAGSSTSVDGNLSVAKFTTPVDIVIGLDENLYISQIGVPKIRKINTKEALIGTPSRTDIGLNDVNLTITDGEANVSHNFTIDVIPDYITGTANSDDLNGTSENDTFVATNGDDSYNGLDGIDTIVLSSNQSTYKVFDNADGTYAISDGTYRYTLQNIELIDFADNTDINLTAIAILEPKFKLKAHGGALQFNNDSNVSVKVADNDLLDPANITVEAWYYKSANGGGKIVNKWDNVNTSLGYVLQMNSDDTAGFYISTDGSTYTHVTTPSLVDEQWYHLAGTFDGSSIKIFVDGVEQNSTALSGTLFNSTASLQINTYSYPDGNQTSGFGIVDEVRIWNTAKLADDIKTNKNLQLDGSESGLVAYYNFDERVGDTVYDITSNNLDATIDENITRLNFLGNTLKFYAADGVFGNDITIADSDDLDLVNTDFTISTWLKVASDSPNHPTILNKLSGNDGYQIALNATTGNIDFTASNSSCTVNNKNYKDNQWHYLSITFINDTNTVKLYIDGNEMNSCNMNEIVATDQTLLLGNNRNIGYNDLKGNLAEVSIWNKALSQHDIQKYMHTTLKDDKTGLVGYWTLREGSGNITYDRQINVAQNNGTINGATWQENAPTIYGDTLYTTVDIVSTAQMTVENNISTQVFTEDTDNPQVNISNNQLIHYTTTDGNDSVIINSGDNNISKTVRIITYKNPIPTVLGDTTISTDTNLTSNIIVNGDLTITGGIINLNGYTVTVSGNIYNSGTISLQNGVLNGSLNINSGNTVLQSDLNITGDLNISAGSLDINGYKLITEGNVYQNGTIYIRSGTFEVKGNYTHSSAYLNLQAGNLKVNGDYNQSHGQINFAGGSVEIAGNYTNTSQITPSLLMANADDYLYVHGNILIDSASSVSSPTNYIRDGIIQLDGNFTQASTSSTSSFATAENHKVILSGSSKQVISFESPTSSFFNILDINNTSTEGVELNSDVKVLTSYTSNAIAKKSNSHTFTVNGIVTTFDKFTTGFNLINLNTNYNDITSIILVGEDGLDSNVTLDISTLSNGDNIIDITNLEIGAYSIKITTAYGKEWWYNFTTEKFDANYQDTNDFKTTITSDGLIINASKENWVGENNSINIFDATWTDIKSSYEYFDNNITNNTTDLNMSISKKSSDISKVKMIQSSMGVKEIIGTININILGQSSSIAMVASIDTPSLNSTYISNTSLQSDYKLKTALIIDETTVSAKVYLEDNLTSHTIVTQEIYNSTLGNYNVKNTDINLNIWSTTDTIYCNITDKNDNQIGKLFTYQFNDTIGYPDLLEFNNQSFIGTIDDSSNSADNTMQVIITNALSSVSLNKNYFRPLPIIENTISSATYDGTSGIDINDISFYSVYKTTDANGYEAIQVEQFKNEDNITYEKNYHIGLFIKSIKPNSYKR
jgi:hypothetical protein